MLNRILFSFAALGAFSLSLSASAAVLITPPPNEKPVTIDQASCRIEGQNLVIEVGKVGRPNSVKIELKTYAEYNLNNRFLLKHSSWGELDFWDKFGARWSIDEERPDSFCTLGFFNLKTNANGVLSSFDLGIKCNGLVAPDVTPTREFTIPLTDPVHCSVRA